MTTLKKCVTCHRTLPRSLYPRHGSKCWWCTFGMPPKQADQIISKIGQNKEIEEIYMEQEQKIYNIIKNCPSGVTRKEISRELGLTPNKVYPYLQNLEAEGRVRVSKEVRDSHVNNIYYPTTDENVGGSGSSCVGDVDENKNTNQKSYSEENRSPGYPDLAETITNTNNNNSWGELRNRLIDAAQKSIPTKQPGLIEALYVMMTMEKEIIEDGGVV